MKKTLRVTLDIEVEDLPDADRVELAEETGHSVGEILKMSSYDGIEDQLNLDDLAVCFSVIVDSDAESALLRFNSGVWANCIGIKLVSADVDEPSDVRPEDDSHTTTHSLH